MSVKARTEKNFRRVQVKPVRKRAAARLAALRLVLSVAAIAAAGYALWVGSSLVLSATTLQIRKISVQGNERLSTGEVHALLGGLRGSSILAADLERYRLRLMESPWVADVALRRVLPGTVEVFVSERRPIGVCRLGTQLYLLDRSGTIIDEYGPQYADFDLPIIDGVVRPPSSGEPSVDEARTALAAAVIDAAAGRGALAARLSQIDVGDLHNAIVLLDGDTALLHLGTEKFAERLHRYLELAPVLREQVAEIDYVDLRFDERVYVRPAGSGKPRAALKPPPAQN